MIGKITKGKSFHSLINYILDKQKDATLIDYKDVMTMSNQDIIKSFNIQAKLNTRVKVIVGHISLDFHKRDLSILSDEKMVEIAQEYLAKMNIVDTQYIIGRHFDKEHPHIHIAFNRIDNQGKTISDKNDFRRNEKICKELTLKFGLYYATGKENVKVHRLEEPDKTKYEIYESVRDSLPKCMSWNDLISNIAKQGIDVNFKNKRGTSEIQGVSFSKNGYTFSGSKIDKAFSYSKISYQLENNIVANNIGVYEMPEKLTSPEFDVSGSIPHIKYAEEDEKEPHNTKKKKKRKSNNKGLTL